MLAYAPVFGICGRDVQCFTAFDLQIRRGLAAIHLGVQLARGLRGKQVQRPAGGHWRSQPFRWRQPGGVGRAIRIAEARDLFRIQLDTAGWRAQRMARGVMAEVLEQHEGLLGLGNGHIPLVPECVELRRLATAVTPRFAHGIENMPYPRHLVAALRVGLFVAAKRSQLPVNVEIIAAGANRSQCLMHGEYVAVPRRSAYVVSFQGRGGWQHDVGAARHGRPPDLVRDDGLWLGPCPAQTIQVLLVMEGIAARPVHHLDIWINAFAPIEFVSLSGVQQHVGDAGHGDNRAGRIAPRFHGGACNLHARVADTVHGSMAERHATAGHADMPQGRRKRDAGPVGLFAPVGALQ